MPLLDAEGFHLLPYRVLNVEKNLNFIHLSPVAGQAQDILIRRVVILKEPVNENIYDKEIAEIKGDLRNIENRVNNLEKITTRQDQQIISINEKLNKIDENTTWIKRTITAAIITAISTGIIGGSIAIFYNVLRGGQ